VTPLLAATGLNANACVDSSDRSEQVSNRSGTIKPLAITMWEFSWLERRWPGAGYENWDKALTELKERGYDAIRIDAFPHFVADDPEKIRKLIPHWDNQCWGSPYYTEVQVQPHLNDFIRKCKEYSITVGLSTWWREDTENANASIQSGRDLGLAWKRTLESIAEEDLLDNIIYVDFSNEYALDAWTPYLPKGTRRNSVLGMQYMAESSAVLREAFPGMPLCFSIANEYDKWRSEDMSNQDLLELHIWIANSSEFNEKVGYHFKRFGNDDYKNLQLNSLSVYRDRERYWLEKLNDRIQLAAKWSKRSGLPLITTECWGPVDYKDMPLLDWQWVKEACEYGTMQAAKTGRWLAIATSNFCGPQFVGMWRDVEWHKRLTDIIHLAPVSSDLIQTKLARRIENLAKTGK
jgi:hypothetical protein